MKIDRLYDPDRSLVVNLKIAIALNKVKDDTRIVKYIDEVLNFKQVYEKYEGLKKKAQFWQDLDILEFEYKQIWQDILNRQDTFTDYPLLWQARSILEELEVQYALTQEQGMQIINETLTHKPYVTEVKYANNEAPFLVSQPYSQVKERMRVLRIYDELPGGGVGVSKLSDRALVNILLIMYMTNIPNTDSWNKTGVITKERDNKNVLGVYDAYKFLHLKPSYTNSLEKSIINEVVTRFDNVKTIEKQIVSSPDVMLAMGSMLAPYVTLVKGHNYWLNLRSDININDLEEEYLITTEYQGYQEETPVIQNWQLLGASLLVDYIVYKYGCNESINQQIIISSNVFIEKMATKVQQEEGLRTKPYGRLFISSCQQLISTIRKENQYLE